MSRDSIRLRLAVWHTLTLALLLGVFAAGTSLFLERSARARADASLGELTDAFEEVWRSGRGEVGYGQDAAEAAAKFRDRERRILVYDARRLIAVSDSHPLAPALTLPALADGPTGPLARLLREAGTGRARFTTVDGGYEDEVPIRARATRVSLGGKTYTIAALRSLRAEDEAREAFTETLGITIPLALLLAGAGGYLLARASLAPVVAMAQQAERTSIENLHERLPVENPHDELGGLATVLNGLLARLEHAFERQRRTADQQRQFMADASHELRTPVTALCSVTDVALARTDRNPEELVEALEVVRGEGRRLGRVVDDLFLLARADAGHVPVRFEPLYLEELLQDAARAARAMAARREIDIDGPPADESPFRGDPQLLQRLVMILLDNAIKYTPPGGHVRLSLAREGSDSYAIAVEDTGPGIDPADQERIFERFVRIDVARSRSGHAGGAGLGLAIARWIAAAHGGTVRLDATSSQGSRFVVHLPQRSRRIDPVLYG